MSLPCHVEETTLYTRSRMIYRDCRQHFLDEGRAASPWDKLQYHTSVHFLNKPQPWKNKKDQLSCRYYSGTERPAPRARVTFLPFQGKSLPLSYNEHITGRAKSVCIYMCVCVCVCVCFS